MKVAAYQAPLLPSGSMAAIEMIRARVEWCEAAGVSLLCCPEAILGGLADDSDDPTTFAITTSGGQLADVLAPLASDRVTTIVGFTELADDGRLYNTAAVFHRGAVVGLYRKLHPAIRRSVYQPGSTTPVFRVGGLTFGIVICNDSNYAEPAQRMASQGAAAIFIPTNTGLPPSKGGRSIAEEARRCDVARAVENKTWIVRADVAGQAGRLVAHGSSAIVDPTAVTIQSARDLREDLIVAEIDISRREAHARSGRLPDRQSVDHTAHD
jgi:predicted amidohydrolase